MIILGRARLIKGLMTAILATTTTSPTATQETATKLEVPSIALSETKTFVLETNKNAAIDKQYNSNDLTRTTPAIVNNYDYTTNPTVFGKILRNELPYHPYIESPTLLSFRDRSPRAPLHALVITKSYIPSVKSLQPTEQDIALLSSMKEMALQIIQLKYPDAYEKGDYILRFHIPPYTSVGHIHLHVLAPASEMKFVYSHGKYLKGSFWCTDVDSVLARLKNGQSAV